MVVIIVHLQLQYHPEEIVHVVGVSVDYYVADVLVFDFPQNKPRPRR